MMPNSGRPESQPAGDELKPPGQANPGRRNYPTWLRLSLALMVIAFAYFYRLDRPLLWGDEAGTGIAARNILHFGYPTVFDGRNAAVCDDGQTLDRNLLIKQIPWAQYYLAAASLAVFGNDTAGLRTLFALVGVLTFFPIYSVLKPRLRFPGLMAVLILLSPQTLLFQRSARYYSLLILLYAVLLWHLTAEFKSRRIRLFTAGLIFILFYHTHVVAGLGSSFSLLLFCLLFRKERFVEYLLAAGAGLLCWLVWYLLLAPPLGRMALPLLLVRANFGHWLKLFLTSLAATVVDFDVIDCFPILLWAALLGFLLLKNRPALWRIFKDPISTFILLSFCVQTVMVAAVFGSETVLRYAILRYLCQFAGVMLIPCFVLVNSVVRSRVLYVFVCIFAVAFNLLTLSFWAKPFPRDVPASWLVPVYSEIFHPREDAWDKTIARLHDDQPVSADRERVIVTQPSWTQELVIFYLGDRYLVPPLFRAREGEAEQQVHRVIGEQAYRRLKARPAWIILYSNDFIHAVVPSGYEIAESIPSYRTRPDDGTRPELTRHTFPGAAVVANINLLRRRDE